MARLPHRQRGTGGRVLHRAHGEKFKKCREHVIGTCNTQTEDCCAVIPCELCLTFTDSYGEVFAGVADWDNATGQYVGTVDSIAFVAYWERDDYDGECYFVVKANGTEVFRELKCELL